MEIDAAADEVEGGGAGGRGVVDGVGVGGVDPAEAMAEGFGGVEDDTEAAELLLGEGGGAFVGQGEVGEEALDVQVREGEEVWEEGGGAVPEETGAAHAGVEGQVADGGAALTHGFGGDVAGGLKGDERKGDAGLNHGADFIGEDTAEDLDGHAKVGQGERLEGFGDGDARGARGDERLGDGSDTQSIGIGLEHGHDGAGRGHAAHGAIVLGQRAEIDSQNNTMLHDGGVLKITYRRVQNLVYSNVNSDLLFRPSLQKKK